MPTTKVAADQALDVAQVHALRKIAASAPAGERRMLEARAAVLDAELNPVATALPLPAYVGVYGERHITNDGGKLVFQREGGQRRGLVAVGPNEFAFAEDPTQRVTFKVAGNSVTELELIRSDGSTVVAARNP